MMIIHSDNLEQSKLRKQLSQFVAEEIRILYGLVAKENRKKNLPMSFEQLIKRIDWSRFSGELKNVDVETPYGDEEWYKNTIPLYKELYIAVSIRRIIIFKWMLFLIMTI